MKKEKIIGAMYATSGMIDRYKRLSYSFQGDHQHRTVVIRLSDVRTVEISAFDLERVAREAFQEDEEGEAND